MKKPVNKSKFMLRFTGFLLFFIGLGLMAYLYYPLLSYHSKSIVSAQSAQPTKSDVTLNNELYIPSIYLKTPIYNGPNISVINQTGSWLKPVGTTEPFEEGNTIIVGHSFTIKNPNAPFYNLDQVNTGDYIFINWSAKNYKYKVIDKQVVLPSDIEIEKNTKQNQLTLYTCYPRFSTAKRLVITAVPVN